MELPSQHPAFLHAALAVLVLSACAAGDAPRQASCEDAGNLPQCFAAKDRDLGQRVHRCGEHEFKSRLDQEKDSHGSAPLAHLPAGCVVDGHVTRAALVPQFSATSSPSLSFAQLPMPPPAV